MAPLTKLFALCLLSATLTVSSPLPANAPHEVAARSPRLDGSVEVVTKGDKKFALVPVTGAGTITVTGDETDLDKRDTEDTGDTDAVAYNPAYQYQYNAKYKYVN